MPDGGAELFESPVKREGDDLLSTMSTIQGATLASPSGTMSPEQPEAKAKVHLQAEIERGGLGSLLQRVLADGEAWPYLDLAENALGDDGARLLREVLDGSPQLRRLNVLRTGMTVSGLEELGALLPSCPRLEALNLGGVDLQRTPVPDRLCDAVRTSTSLRILHLTHCRLTSAHCRPLLNALVGSGSSHLERLNLSYNDLDSVAVAEMHRIFDACPRLSTLCLSANKLGPKGGDLMAGAITKASRSATQLMLDHNNLLQRGCQALVRAWKEVQRTRPLTLLDLRDNGLTEGQCHDLAQELGKPAAEPKLNFEGGSRQVLLSWPEKSGSLHYSRHAAAHSEYGRREFPSCDPVAVRWWGEARPR